MRRKMLGIAILLALSLMVLGLYALGPKSERLYAPGAVATDNVPLTQSIPLRHLASVLENKDIRKARDLIEQTPSFARAPNPEALLATMQAMNPPATEEAVGLRVMTWNVAFLDYYVGPKHWAWSPYMDVRRGGVLQAAFSGGYDVVLLQEVWRKKERSRFAQAAEEAGYWAVAPDKGYQHGLMTFVKKSIAVNKPDEVRVRPYGVQDKLEKVRVPGVKQALLRCWLRARFEHPELGPITLFNTHMQAFPSSWAARIEQARELGILASERPNEELVMVAGDMNAGPYYKSNDWTRMDGVTESVWFTNAVSYPVLLHYGELVDLSIRGRSVEDALLDVSEGRKVVNDPKRARIEPALLLGCGGLHNNAFTATDCNDLYRMQYGGTEAPARLDHILARDPQARIHTAAWKHRFTGLVTDTPDGKVELSDHAAVTVDLLIKP